MADEFICDTGEVRRFIVAVKKIVSGTASVEARLEAIRPLFQSDDGRSRLAAGGVPPNPGSGGDGQRDRKLASVPGYGGDSFPLRPGVAAWRGHTCSRPPGVGVGGVICGRAG